VIPQPVYMNSDELEKLRQQKATSEEKSDELPEDDLKTPTIEELTFPGHHRVVKNFRIIYSLFQPSHLSVLFLVS